MANVKIFLSDDNTHPKTTSAPIDSANCANSSHETSNGSWHNIEYADVKLLQASPLLSGDVSFDPGSLRTSTPDPPRSSSRKYHSVRISNGVDPRNSAFSSAVIYVGADEVGGDVDVGVQQQGQQQEEEEGQRRIEVFDQVQVPIVGYETIEERAKFTVFKLEVKKSSQESWYIFRRYSDFQRLKRQVKRIFPEFRLSLPPKKWFGDNFETVFLDQRMNGLQIFINDILSNKDINTSAPVRQFFCFDEPPGPYESLEESRAMCESLEDQIYRLTIQIQERDDRIENLESELKESREKIGELERTSAISASSSSPCSCGSRHASSVKLSREVDSNENLTKHS